MIDYRLYLVTDDPSRYRGDWLERVVAAVEGGVTCVQYRDTENSREVQFERIRRLQEALQRFQTPIIVNNDAELARATGAQGVHVGQGDMPVDAVRRIVGPQVEIGLSITAPAQLAECRNLGRDAKDEGWCQCLGVGPVWDARKTKADASAAVGIASFAEMARSIRSLREEAPARLVGSNSSPDFSPTPAIVAIGGIGLANAAEVIAAGAEGIAVVSALSQAADPCQAAKELRALVN